MKKQFFKDIKKFCDIINARDLKNNNLFLEIDNKEHKVIKNVIHMLKTLGLENSNPNRFALLCRLINFQEAPIIQVLKKAHKTPIEIKEAKKILFEWVKEYHTQNHKNIIEECENNKLFTPFYRQVIQGMHTVGKAFSALHLKWKCDFIEGINVALLKEYQGDTQKLLEYLDSVKEISTTGEISDRSYSIPHKKNGQLIALPYALAFKKEVRKIQESLSKLLRELEHEGDDIFSSKQAYINYFNSIKNAITEERIENLLERWRLVDKAWMQIKTPLQPAHPLEYYEDPYRRAVAPEWDLRISCQEHIATLPIKKEMQETIIQLYTKWHEDIQEHNQSVVLNALKKTNVYVSIPALYYGAEFDGLFSAQVVPNDEVISSRYGKKIFAFPVRILRYLQHQPFMRLQSEIFPQNFIQEIRDLLFFNEEKWYKVYQVTTIGHEFGHILWIEEDTEIKMNASGNFKNIEEFKATAGGLVNFFLNDTNAIYAPLKKPVIAETIRRAVGLIAWKEQQDMEAYYCEALIHLHILFESEMLKFNKTCLQINLDNVKYEYVKKTYLKYYRELAILYVKKADSSIFLNQFALRDSGSYFKPKNTQARAFVEYYWKLYQEIGQEIETNGEHRQYIQKKIKRLFK